MESNKKEKPKKKVQGLQRRKAISGYMFIMPFIIGFLVFMVRPIISSFYMSFCSVDISKGGAKTFIGLFNYNTAFRVDIQFTTYVTEELLRMCINTLAIMVFSFFVALILNQKFKGRALVRAIFFLPVILSSGAIIGVESSNSLLSGMQDMIKESGSDQSITGVIQKILMTSGMGNKLFETIFDVVDGIYDVAIASGIQIIIFLSGMQTISKNMYEAAEIEGCTSWECLWKITFPMISPLLLVNWVYTIVDFCMRTDNKVIDKINKTMTVMLDYGFASAMAWSYYGIVIVIIGVTSLIISKGVYYYE